MPDNEGFGVFDDGRSYCHVCDVWMRATPKERTRHAAAHRREVQAVERRRERERQREAAAHLRRLNELKQEARQ